MSEPCELQAIEGPLKGRRFVVTEAGLKLGRASSCDIAVSDPALSRNHCIFELRNGAVWVTDLASANGTEVNGEPVAERELKAGDRVVAGDSSFEVVPHGTPVDSSTTSQISPLGSVDLGFARGTVKLNRAGAPRQGSLRPVLWGAGGLAVVVAVAVILLGPAGDPSGESQRLAPLSTDRPRIISMYYEKVEASAAGIFRYSATVSRRAPSDGGKTMLAVTVDDALTDNRHLDKDKELSDAALERLSQTINSSGVLSLDGEYSGLAANPNELKSIRLKVVRNDVVFETYAENSAEPEALRSAAAAIEAFSKNELGIWAIQYSSDKLVEMAEAALKAGDAKWEERDVQYGNIAAAIRQYREAVADLETVNPKPDYYPQLVERLAAAQKELDGRYRDQVFQCERAIQLEEWDNARSELRILCELVPDEQDPRHADAAAKLLDVEARMKRK